MPRISAFYGIVITMYFNDHSPPHFHAIYGDFEAKVSISNLTIIDGELPVRARRLVVEWAGIHRAELVENWERARAGATPATIDPLP